MAKTKVSKETETETVVEAEQAAPITAAPEQKKPAQRELNIFEKFIMQAIKMRRLQKDHKKRGGQHRFNDKKIAEEKFDLLLGAILNEANKQSAEPEPTSNE